MRQKQQVFAVIRVDEFQGLDVPIENKVTVKQIVSTLRRGAGNSLWTPSLPSRNVTASCTSMIDA
jgi:hypothetical protein